MIIPAKDTAGENTITEVTRRAIIDYLCVGRHWSGALPEDDFLGRLYDLNRMSSTDYRREYDTAAKDIWKHRVMNSDWPDDWVFTDSRPDTADAEAMVAEYNAALAVDGWEIYPVRRISNKPVFGYRPLLSPPHLEEAKQMAERLTGPYVSQQIRRLQEAADADPELAIGTAKEFLEGICKTILSERGTPPSKTEDLPTLVRSTIKSLQIVPSALTGQARAEKAITVLLNNLGSIGQQLAELRNQFGTGHGRTTVHVSLPARHAKLAIGAAATLAVFLYETHEAELQRS
jgi:hypothetical protein